MKLVQIWNAQNAWKALSSLKKNPKLAYRLMKYEKKYDAELQACDEQRQKYVRECASKEQTDLKPGTPEFSEFLSKFNAFVQTDSDLEWAGVTMDELIDALDAESGNVLSENDLGFLEPFFAKPE